MGLVSTYGVCVTDMGLGYLQKKSYGANLTGFSTVPHVRASGQTLTKKIIAANSLPDGRTLEK